MTVAALYVQKGGAYYDPALAGLVDPWDEERDARLYAGPWPVVAHPPCSRWCRLAGLVEARYGHKRHEDGGCFAAALAAVRMWGGVLEHPAFTDAWWTFGLPRPPSTGGWVRGLCGGWACHVEQGHYGHRAPKATWLYAYGVPSLPSMRWGASGAVGRLNTQPGESRAEHRIRVTRDRRHVPRATTVAFLDDKGERSATPPEFRDVLLGIARSAAKEAA